MKIILITIIGVFFCLQGAFSQVTVTKGRNVDLAKDSYLFVDASDTEIRESIVSAFSSNKDYFIFVPRNGSTDSPIIITKKKKGLTKDKALQDCLIGVGGYLFTILFVQAAGEEIDDNTQVEGLYVTAGNKVVQGGAAAFAFGTCLTGVGFGIKGFIEIFRPKSKLKPVEALSSEAQKTEAIINYSGLVKIDEKVFSDPIKISEIASYIQLQLL